MKKVLFLIVSIVILGLVFAGCGGISNITTPSSTVEQGVIYLDRNGELPCQGTYPLYAGQDNLVGEVIVTDDGANLCVEYVLDQEALNAGWLIYETHIAVGADAGDIPQTKPKKDEEYGNPKVGNFPYGADDLEGVKSYKECFIPIPVDCGVPFVIAAHAVVEREVCKLIVPASDDAFWVSDETTMVTEVNGVDVADFHAELAHKPGDSGSPYGPVWDTEPTFDFHESAKWIWESYHVFNPIAGDVVTFEKEFEVPGIPADGGTLAIACDNGFAVYLNDVPLGFYNLSGYPPLPNLMQPNVNTTDWKYVQWYNLDATNLKQGTNTLKIIGVNEYLDTDDDNGAGGWNPLGTVFNNPGGVIFSFCAHWDDYFECETESQTAWAAMCGAPGSIRFVEQGNWATYFFYTVECLPELIETIDIDPSVISGIDSINTLADEVEYEFRVTGTWENRGWEKVDAKYCSDNNWATPGTEAPSGGYPDELLELFVDAARVDWGSYSDTHTYSIDFTGTGSTVNFAIYDSLDTSWYSDNMNSTMQVEIWTK